MIMPNLGDLCKIDFEFEVKLVLVGGGCLFVCVLIFFIHSLIHMVEIYN